MAVIMNSPMEKVDEMKSSVDGCQSAEASDPTST